MARRRSKHTRIGPFGSAAATSMFLLAALFNMDLQNSVAVTTFTISTAAVPFINPPARNNGKEQTPASPDPLYVELNWTDGMPHDLDLWLRCYQEEEGSHKNEFTIGFKRTSDGWMDLTRDDLGQPSYLNREIAKASPDIARVPPNTVCIFNAHLYHTHGGIMPLKARLLIIQDFNSQNEKTVADATFEMTEPLQEMTVVYARWDQDGNLLKNSVKKYPEAPQAPIATVPLPEQVRGL